MGFDAEAYRREARAQNIPDDLIEADIAEELANQKGQFAEPTAEDVKVDKNSAIPGWLMPAAGVAAGVVTGAAAKSIYDRYIGGIKPPTKATPDRIEPKMDVNQRPAEARVEPTWDPKQIIKQANEIQSPVQAEAQQMANDAKVKAVSEGIIAPGQGGKISPTDMGMLASSEKAKVEKEVTKTGIKPPTPLNPERFVPPISTDVNELQLTKNQQAAKGWLQGQWGGPRNYYEGVQKIFGGVPPSYTAEKGQHAIGPEAHQQILDWRKQNIAGPKINLTKEMKDLFQESAKGGSTGAKAIAALLALPAFANAAQSGKEGDTSKTLGSIVEGLSAFFGPIGALAGGVLGTSPEEIEILRKAEQAKKAGAGRGTTSASAYQR